MCQNESRYFQIWVGVKHGQNRRLFTNGRRFTRNYETPYFLLLNRQPRCLSCPGKKYEKTLRGFFWNKIILNIGLLYRVKKDFFYWSITFKRNWQNIYFSYKYTVLCYDLVLYKQKTGKKKDLTLNMTDFGIFSAKMTSDSR